VTTRDVTSLVDIHSHLVPGVDDGARHIAAVVSSVERMTVAGIRRIVTTPHIQASLTLDPPSLEARLSEVDQAFEAASAAVKEAFPEVEFLRGHEVMIDVPEPELDDPRIRMNGTPFVLIEWPRLHVPPGTPRVIQWIRDQGYRPVIAHPERYSGVPESPGILRRWKAAGAYLQVNYGSLVGRYGAAARELAFLVLEKGLADYLASDFHGRSGLKIYKQEAWDVLESRDATEILQTLCRANPSRLIEGLEPLPVLPLSGAPGLFGRLRGMVTGRDRRTADPRTASGEP
jgi:protein-tyrosine phosphatase